MTLWSNYDATATGTHVSFIQTHTLCCMRATCPVSHANALAVWPVFVERSPMVETVFWKATDNTHPDWSTLQCATLHAQQHNRSHQLYADLLIHYLESTYATDCELASESQHWTVAIKTFADAPVFGATTEKFERAICYGAAATSSFDAVDPSSYNSTISFKTTAGVVVAEPTAAAAAGADASAVANADWTLTEDRAGKPGYIAEGVSHAVLTARMQCSAKRSSDAAGSLYIPVAVTYTQSYEGVGAVLMYSPHKHQPHMRGRHAQAAAAVISSHTKAASSKDSHSSYMIDALDVSAHVSPYVTES
eukprot:1505-Heterococcus_DN1.PRE.2